MDDQIRQLAVDLDQRKQNLKRNSDDLCERTGQLIKLVEDYCARNRREMERREYELGIRRNLFEEEKARFEDSVQKAFKLCAEQHPGKTVILAVGGKEFETTRFTVLEATVPPDENSILAVMLKKLDEELRPSKIKVDRSPNCFEYILDYIRERTAGTEADWIGCWVGDCDVSKLKLIRLEAEYYKIRSFSNYITWELARRERRSRNQVTELKLEPLRNTINSFQTTDEVTVKEMSFEGAPSFKSILFRHRVNFQGCLLKGTVFQQCQFLANVVFSDCDITDMKFIGCQGPNSPTPTSAPSSPADLVILQRCIGQLPLMWR